MSLMAANEESDPSAILNGFWVTLLLSGGSRIRTYDLWVMSPTSYLCSIPRCDYGCKGTDFF